MFTPLKKLQNKIIALSEAEALDLDIAYRMVSWIAEIDDHIKNLEENHDRLKEELDFWQDKRLTTPTESDE